MPRKKLPPPVVVPIILRLRPAADADLISFFESLPPYRRARAVKVVLRQGGITHARAAVDVISDAEVLNLLEQLSF